MHQLRDIGVRIALDDFGIGYSSLSYLRRFPFDKIKIDRSFVADLGDDDCSSTIVQAVVVIAQSRGMETTAEGVETDEQLPRLKQLRCSQVQGWRFSAALPVHKIKALLGMNASQFERGNHHDFSQPPSQDAYNATLHL